MYNKDVLASIQKEIEEIERLIALVKAQMENLQKEDSKNSLPNEQLLSRCVTDENKRMLPLPIGHELIDYLLEK